LGRNPIIDSEGVEEQEGGVEGVGRGALRGAAWERMGEGGNPGRPGEGPFPGLVSLRGNILWLGKRHFKKRHAWIRKRDSFQEKTKKDPFVVLV